MWNSVQLRHIAHILYDLEAFISLFKNSLPALRSVTVWFSGFDESAEFPSWLHVILATGRPIPGILKTIVLQSNHRSDDYTCCMDAVGTSLSEEVGGFAKHLPELLAELAELVLRLDECSDPARHAAYIWDVLPGMRNVLRVEYRAYGDVDWKPYTVLPDDVLRFLAQDTDSESESDSDSDSGSGSHLDDNCEDILST